MIYHIYDSSKVDWLGESDDKNNIWIEYREYNGEAEPDKDILVKETIESDKFLKLVLKYHNPNKNKLFHIFYNPNDDYIITDCVINYKPTIKEKLNIAISATKYYISHLKSNLDSEIIINFLTPNGHLSPVIPTSIENQAICKMLYDNNDLILGYNYIFDYKQLDFCLNDYARVAKDIHSNWSHNANVIVVNDLNEGNTLYKALSINNTFFGYVIGANVNVVLNSRSYLYLNQFSCGLLDK